MAILTRRSVLRSSLGLLAASALARPHIANAAATTAEVWWTQGFAQEEDVAFKKLIADYEKASGNKIEDSVIPLFITSFIAMAKTCSLLTCARAGLYTS